MDLVGYDQAVLDRILADYSAFASGGSGLPPTSPRFPSLASRAEQLSTRVPFRKTTPRWYDGPALIDYLELSRSKCRPPRKAQAFRMPVQWGQPPQPLISGGFAGPDRQRHRCAPTIAVRIVPSGQRPSKVKTITTFDGELQKAGRRGSPSPSQPGERRSIAAAAM